MEIEHSDNDALPKLISNRYNSIALMFINVKYFHQLRVGEVNHRLFTFVS